jgi:lysophospholipase L1-like esterase
MAPLPVLNRAFGGSKTQDQLDRFDQVVKPHGPRVVVYYCGSNDLKASDDPQAIFGRFKAFSERLHREFPDCRLIVVSSTRSPDRVPIWERVDQYNGLVRAHCAATPRHTFIDLNPVLVDADGRPRLELYRDDRLHFHPKAYEEFARRIRPVLENVWREAQEDSANNGPETRKNPSGAKP